MGGVVARDMLGRPLYDRQQTNADRIRAMTDAELADWIVEIELQADCLGGTFGAEYWLDWLKQEATDV